MNPTETIIVAMIKIKMLINRRKFLLLFSIPEMHYPK